MALGPLGPTILPRVHEIELDWVVLAFALAVAVAAGLLFTVAPAIRLSRVDGREAFSASNLATRTPLAGAGSRGVGHTLAVARLALATTLLVGAGLVLHSFLNLTRVHLGFDLQTQIFQLVPPGEYARSRKLALAYEVGERLRRHPGVKAVGFTNTPPFATDSMRGTFLPPERESERGSLGRESSSQIRAVSPDYLRALGVRLVEGRWLDERDGARQPQVVVVNRAWVQRFSPNRSPLGSPVHTAPNDTWQIVGVVDDVRLRMDEGPGALPSNELPMIAFVDIRQVTANFARGQIDRPRRPDLDALRGGTRGLAFALRAGSPVDTTALRAAVSDVHPGLAVEGFTTIGDVFGALTGRQRFYTVLMAAFGATAAFIAAIGIYGVLAYGMTQRTHEFGIRLALGAEPRSVLTLAMRQGVGLIGVGILYGLGGAVAITLSREHAVRHNAARSADIRDRHRPLLDRRTDGVLSAGATSDFDQPARGSSI